MQIEEIKASYTIYDAWGDEGLDGIPGKSCCSPLRVDRHPSFSVFNDGRAWNDFGTDEGGDVIDFICKIRGCGIKEALAIIENHINGRNLS